MFVVNFRVSDLVRNEQKAWSLLGKIDRHQYSLSRSYPRFRYSAILFKLLGLTNTTEMSGCHLADPPERVNSDV